MKRSRRGDAGRVRQVYCTHHQVLEGEHAVVELHVSHAVGRRQVTGHLAGVNIVLHPAAAGQPSGQVRSGVRSPVTWPASI